MRKSPEILAHRRVSPPPRSHRKHSCGGCAPAPRRSDHSPKADRCTGIHLHSPKDRPPCCGQFPDSTEHPGNLCESAPPQTLRCGVRSVQYTKELGSETQLQVVKTPFVFAPPSHIRPASSRKQGVILFRNCVQMPVHSDLENHCSEEYPADNTLWRDQEYDFLKFALLLS